MRLRDLLLSLIIIPIVVSCNETKREEVQKTTSPEINLPNNYALLEGKWNDSKDSSHAIIFTNKKWIDLYNAGKFIQLEESPGHNYYLIIQELDSSELHLEFITSGIRYELYR
jgi:hypothetical protein